MYDGSGDSGVLNNHSRIVHQNFHSLPTNKITSIHTVFSERVLSEKKFVRLYRFTLNAPVEDLNAIFKITIYWF